MEPKTSLRQEPAYQKLQEFYDLNSEKINIQQLFQQDPDRFNKFRYIFRVYLKFFMLFTRFYCDFTLKCNVGMM